MAAIAQSAAAVAPTDAYRLLKTSLALFKKPLGELTAPELSRVQQQAAQECLIEARVLNSQEATGVVISEQEVERAYQEIRSRYADEAAFSGDLTRNRLNEQSLRNALHRQCKIDTVLDWVGSRAASVSEVEIGIYYHLHPEQFRKPERREACHIFISINADYPENTRDAAKARIADIHERLQKKPHKFADLAMKHSECPTALQGGVLGVVPRGKLYPELDAALFVLKAGGISGVVESEIGFHILLCKHIHKEEMLPLQQAAPKIRQMMQERAQRTCQRAWLASLAK